MTNDPRNSTHTGALTSRIATKVQIDRASIFYGDIKAVDQVSLVIEPGEILALVGPSGCGKTSLLKSIAGLQDLVDGQILFDEKRIDESAAHKRNVGMVFQNYALFPHMNVHENVAFGLRMAGISAIDKTRRVATALDLLHISHLSKSWPDQLSGGQQQRVALARTLVCEPRVLLLDEPLSALDRQLRDTMRAEIRRLVKAVGITTILVTHDQDEAMSMADRVAVMRAGRIEQIGTPRQLYENPHTEFVAGFIGRHTRLIGHVIGVNGLFAKVAVPGGIVVARLISRPEQAVSGVETTVLIRPDGIATTEGIAQLSATVEDHLFLGERVELSLMLQDGARLKIETSVQDLMPVNGSKLGLVVAAEKAFAFVSHDRPGSSS